MIEDFKTDNWGRRRGSILAPSGQVIATTTEGSENSKFGGNVIRSSAPQAPDFSNYLPKTFLASAQYINQYTQDGEGEPELVSYTSIAINTPVTPISLTSGMKLQLKQGGYCQSITLTADVSDGDTSISVSSFTPNADYPEGTIITIDEENLLFQYQKKTEGEIAGFSVSSTGLTKGGITINGFLDSDTMEGVSATTIPTSESVKAYVDSQSGGGSSPTSNFKAFKCSTTTTTSVNDGEAYAVVIPFDTQLATSSSSNISFLGSSGAEGIEGSEYSWTMGTGNFLMSWNVGSDTNIVNNRILSGVKLQIGVASDSVMEWTDVAPSHGYIYDRGNGNVRKGSMSFTTIYRNLAATNYFRLVFFKVESSNASTTAITLVNATSISITEQQ